MSVCPGWTVVYDHGVVSVFLRQESSPTFWLRVAQVVENDLLSRVAPAN